jgi:prophage antirepressor-like protein
MKVVGDFYKKRGIGSNDSPNLGVKTISLQEGKNHTQLTIINEQWLYELIFASRKQTAIVFRAWVTGEVLPSLRKHGEYRMQGKLIRKSLTDTIKAEICDKTENQNIKKFAYSNYSRLINKSLDLPPKVDRKSLDDETLEKIAKKENLVQALIAENKRYEEIKAILLN